MKKVIWIDTETTGLNSKAGKGGVPLKQTSCIVNIAGIVEIDGKARQKFNFYCQPINWKAVDPEALEINKITLEQLKTYPKPQLTYKKLLKIFSKYIDKYNKDDKFYFGGWNTSFDMDMLNNFFQKMGDPYLGSWIKMSGQVDGLKLASYLGYKGFYDLDSFALPKVCKQLEVSLKDAHTALADIVATYKVTKKIDKILNRGMLDVL